MSNNFKLEDTYSPAQIVKELDKWGKLGLEKSKDYIQQINKLLNKKNIDLTLVYLEEPIFMLNSIKLKKLQLMSWKEITQFLPRLDALNVIAIKK